MLIGVSAFSVFFLRLQSVFRRGRRFDLHLCPYAVAIPSVTADLLKSLCLGRFVDPGKGRVPYSVANLSASVPENRGTKDRHSLAGL
jgi:hypothetical protein